MSTRIVFDNGHEIDVAQDEDDVVLAVRRDHPHPVTLESTAGRPMYVNWDHVAFLQEADGLGPAAG